MKYITRPYFPSQPPLMTVFILNADFEAFQVNLKILKQPEAFFGGPEEPYNKNNVMV